MPNLSKITTFACDTVANTVFRQSGKKFLSKGFVKPPLAMPQKPSLFDLKELKLYTEGDSFISKLTKLPNKSEIKTEVQDTAESCIKAMEKTNYELDIKPSEFLRMLERRKDIPQELIPQLKTPEQLKLYDLVINLEKIKNMSLEDRTTFLNKLFDKQRFKYVEASAQLDVIPDLINKGYDPMLLSKLYITEANKNQIEYLIQNTEKLKKGFIKRAKTNAINTAQRWQSQSKKPVSDTQLQEWIESEFRSELKKKDCYFENIFKVINDNNAKYLDKCLDLGISPSNLAYFEEDTAKIIREFLPKTRYSDYSLSLLDRIHRRGHNYQSIKEIFGNEQITSVTERLLEFRNYKKYKDIGLEEYAKLSTEEKKEFLNSFISTMAPKEVKWPSQSHFDKEFFELQKRMKIFREIKSDSKGEMLTSYQDVLRKLLNDIPIDERQIPNIKINTNSYRKIYRDANPIPPLVDDISQVCELRSGTINGHNIKAFELPYDTTLGISTHRFPNPEAIMNIESLEITDPNMFLCVGTKGGSNTINAGGSEYAIIYKPRRTNDLHVQAFTDIDSGNNATKNVFNFENVALPERGNHGMCIDLIPNLIKKKLDLSQREYTKRILALGDATTLQDVAKKDKELEQCIREIIKEQNLLEGIVRGEPMGVILPRNITRESISPEVLSYCERRNLPIGILTRNNVKVETPKTNSISFVISTDV